MLVALAAAWEAQRTPRLAADWEPAGQAGVAETLRLPAGVPAASIVGDPLLSRDGVGVWSVRHSGDRARVTRYIAHGAQLRPAFSSDVDLVGMRRPSFSIGTWTGKKPALFVLGTRGRRIAVRVVSLSDPARLVAAGTGVVAPDGSRSVALARWSGRLPDLIVVDRNLERGGGRVTVLWESPGSSDACSPGGSELTCRRASPSAWWWCRSCPRNRISPS